MYRLHETESQNGINFNFETASTFIAKLQNILVETFIDISNNVTLRKFV